MNDFSAIILAGGRATRMNGRDKGLVEWRGQPLVAHVLERLRDQVDDVVISCNRHPEAYARFGVCAADTTGNYAGPLAGIAACLPLCRHARVLVTACDMPCLPRDLVARLAAAFQADTDVAVIHDGEHLQSLAMLVDRRVLPGLESALARGHAAVHRWLSEQRHVVVHYPDPAAFVNFNTLEELAEAASRP